MTISHLYYFNLSVAEVSSYSIYFYVNMISGSMVLIVGSPYAVLEKRRKRGGLVPLKSAPPLIPHSVTTETWGGCRPSTPKKLSLYATAIVPVYSQRNLNAVPSTVAYRVYQYLRSLGCR
jgi:hypothetical protein